MSTSTNDDNYLQESTVKQLLELNKSTTNDGKSIRITAENVRLLTIIANKFIHETIERALHQTIEHGETRVDVEHLLKILPQLLIDFV